MNTANVKNWRDGDSDRLTGRKDGAIVGSLKGDRTQETAGELSSIFPLLSLLPTLLRSVLVFLVYRFAWQTFVRPSVRAWLFSFSFHGL